MSGAKRAGPTVNHACLQWAVRSSLPRLPRSLHTAAGSLLPGTRKAFLRTDGRVGKTQHATFHADI